MKLRVRHLELVFSGRQIASGNNIIALNISRPGCATGFTNLLTFLISFREIFELS